MEVFASQSPGFYDDLLLIDSTPVECARSRETVKRSAARRRRGLRVLRQSFPLLLGFPVARDLRARRHSQSARAGLAQARRTRDRAQAARPLPPPRQSDPDRRQGLRRSASSPSRSRRPQRHDPQTTTQRRARHGPHLAPIRQRIESIFWTCKDLLTLERHGARTLPGLRERILQRLLCLAAAITLNHQLGRPSRALVNYCA